MITGKGFSMRFLLFILLTLFAGSALAETPVKAVYCLPTDKDLAGQAAPMPPRPFVLPAFSRAAPETVFICKKQEEKDSRPSFRAQKTPDDKDTP
jgi:hypothetical protein